MTWRDYANDTLRDPYDAWLLAEHAYDDASARRDSIEDARGHEPLDAVVQTSANQEDLPRMTFRDMDALVAEAVFGFRFIRPGVWLDPATGETAALPEYSCSMGAAWSAIEKLGREGYQLDLQETVGVWQASFDASLVPLPHDREIYVADGDTAPLAAMMAALQVRGIYIDEDALPSQGNGKKVKDEG